MLAGFWTALVAAFIACGSSVAQDRNYVYTNAGVYLPQPTQTYGQDEVQAAGGVACRSAVGGGGPYIDAGVVGSGDKFSEQVTTAYARVVVPLGRAPKRLDCTKLYALEIERLKMELELARMSMPPPAAMAGAAPRPPSPLAQAAPMSPASEKAMTDARRASITPASFPAPASVAPAATAKAAAASAVDAVSAVSAEEDDAPAPVAAPKPRRLAKAAAPKKPAPTARALSLRPRLS